MKLAVNLAPVEETLLVPLWARAEEARELEPVLRDPRASAIRARLDFDFERLDGARASQLGCCVRGDLMDRWVRTFLAEHPDGTVVELGCGLNTRFERVDNGRVRWFDLDLPGVIALRRQFFTDAPRHTMLAGSVLETPWIEALPCDGPMLFVTEGMLPYLQPTEVRALFTRLASCFPGAQIAFDAMTPLVLRHQHRHDAMRHFRARFAWSVDTVVELERWDPRIRIEESRRFHDLLAGHPRRLPRTLRWLARGLGFVYPPFKHAYTINRARLG